MLPGGHLATGLGLGALTYAGTGSAELAAGCLAGAFLIDADHYLDYLVVEGQWRRPGPLAFLRYSFAERSRRLLLLLHSWELLAALALLAAAWPRAALLGYLAGALLHLAFDVRVNGEAGVRRPIAFYSIGYRTAHRFAAERLLHPPALRVVPPDAGARPVRDFFGWRPRVRPAPVVAGEPAVLVGPAAGAESGALR